MQLIRGLSAIGEEHKRCVLTIGNFDGVHLGHQDILSKVNERARRLGVPSCVMVFEPLPREYFGQGNLPSRIQTFREKLETLDKYGIDQLLCVHFNTSFRNITARGFIEDVLVKGLNISHLSVGDDFRFGCDRSGTFATLQEAGKKHGFTVANTHSVVYDGERVSSTRVRNLLLEGRFQDAEALLGRPFVITGRVLHGQKLGRQLGVPTANLKLGRRQSPVQGVYAVRVHGLDKVYGGVANVGVRPTVADEGKRLEVHLLDFSGDIYSHHLQVEFVEKIREEKKFDSLTALKTAIENDIARARAVLAGKLG